MPLWRIAEEFALNCALMKDEAELRASLEAVARELGFSYFALVHALSFRRSSPLLVKIDNYPTWWSERFVDLKLFLDDPVLLVSQRCGRGFGWHELWTYLTPEEKYLAILEAAAGEGVGNGFTQPVNIPGEPNGSCSFATRIGVSLPFRCMHCAGVVGGFAFECARRLRGWDLGRTLVPHLSPRQLDCLWLLARGRSDKQIARDLDLRPDTVKTYMKALRLVLGASCRAEVVTKALRLGIVGFDDAIPHSG